MSLITLTTDFGFGSPYVAAMKGVILGINAAVRLADISHQVPPQDVRYGAVVLAEATTWFPPLTIHVAVVDPGVGTARKIIYARFGDQQYLAPDNGLLSLLAKRERPSCIVELGNADYWLPVVSSTFHGRDILAPVAAQLSLGLEPERLGPIRNELQMLDWPDPRRVGNRVEGIVQWIDWFGNAITNITAGMIADASPADMRIRCKGREIVGLAITYGNQDAGQVVALVGSSGHLEIAIVGGNAAESLNITSGDPVTLELTR